MIPKRVVTALLALLVIFIIAVSGYMIIEKWSFLDSCYMAVITLGTIGYREITIPSPAGMVFNMIVILCGIVVLAYGTSSITAFFVEGELKDILKKRKVAKMIEKLKGHFIVCGADKTGQVIIDELTKTKRQFAVVEKDHAIVDSLMQKGVLAVEGDATHDTVLLSAGIKNASGLITVLPADKDNLFVVLTARGLNSSLRIISKATEEQSEEKLKRAGADSVVNPSFIGGMRLVSTMIRPAVVSFLDTMLREKKEVIRIEEVKISKASSYIGKTLGEIKRNENVIILAVNDPNSATLFNPKSQTKLQEAMDIVVMGHVDEISRFKKDLGVEI